MSNEKNKNKFEIPSSYYIFPFGVITQTAVLWDALSLRDDKGWFNEKESGG